MVLNWKWLDDLFGPAYDLYYLDPLAIKIPLEAYKAGKKPSLNVKKALAQLKDFGKKQKSEWYTTDFGPISQLGVDIRKALGVKSSRPDLGEFTDSTLQEEFLKDYGKQTQIAKLLGGCLKRHHLMAALQLVVSESKIWQSVSINGAISQIAIWPNRLWSSMEFSVRLTPRFVPTYIIR